MRGPAKRRSARRNLNCWPRSYAKAWEVKGSPPAVEDLAETTAVMDTFTLDLLRCPPPCMRFVLHRTPSIFAGIDSRPSASVSSLARVPPRPAQCTTTAPRYDLTVSCNWKSDALPRSPSDGSTSTDTGPHRGSLRVQARLVPHRRSTGSAPTCAHRRTRTLRHNRQGASTNQTPVGMTSETVEPAARPQRVDFLDARFACR